MGSLGKARVEEEEKSVCVKKEEAGPKEMNAE